MKKDHLFPILAFILTGLSSWILLQTVELVVHIEVIKEEILNLNKDISRIYNHIDTMINK